MGIKARYIIILFLLLLPFAGCSLVYGKPERHTALGMPRYFPADYDSVWHATISALDEEGYVIALMSKADGYIFTNWKESGYYREKVSVRFEKGNAYVKVTITDYSQSLDLSSKKPNWEEGSPSSWYQQWILDDIGARLGK